MRRCSIQSSFFLFFHESGIWMIKWKIELSTYTFRIELIFHNPSRFFKKKKNWTVRILRGPEWGPYDCRYAWSVAAILDFSILPHESQLFLGDLPESWAKWKRVLPTANEWHDCHSLQYVYAVLGKRDKWGLKLTSEDILHTQNKRRLES